VTSPAAAPASAAAEPAQRGSLTPVEWARLFAPGVVWGTSFFFIAEALDAFSPALITPMRILLGFATLACFRAARAPLPREVLPKVALLGFVWMAFPLSMFPFAEERVSSSVTGMLNGATPLFVAIVASIIHRRVPSRGMTTGLLVGLVGVALISVPTLGEGSSSGWGVAMIMAALVFYGFALNLAVPLQQQYGALPVMWRAQAFALLFTTPLGVYGLGDSTFAWHSMFAMLGLGAFGTALAYVLVADNAGRIGSTRASVTTYIIPVVALALGVVILDESVAALALVGCAVALLGAYLAGRSRH
jgi:drug/metabolite transporter (DMT)-like permease